MRESSKTGPADHVRVAFVQTAPAFGDVPGNLHDAEEAILGIPDVDVVVLPELFSTGYLFADRAELEGLAEDREGPTCRAIRRWAERGPWIAAGFAERDGPRVFNSAALAGPDGSFRIYRKVHLFDRETLVFDPGDRPFEAWTIETGAGVVRVGLMICFDWVYPESARSLVLDGAEILLHPSNLVLPHCQEAMKTRCLENGVFAVTANRAGRDERPHGALEFTGASQIVNPRGEVLVRAPQEGRASAVRTLPLGDARDKRITPRNDLLRDRRAECYRSAERESRD